MKVLVAKYSGFCPGVVQAEEAIFSTKNKVKNEKIYILGYLIHNHTYIDFLEENDIHTIQNPNEAPPGSLLVIRTHGINRQLENALSKNYSLVDLTCPKVKKIQKLIQSYAEKGYYIVITGHMEHPEVQGLVSYANQYRVIGNEDDIEESIQERSEDQDLSVLLVSQTTGYRELFETAVRAWKEAGESRGWNVEFYDSICPITSFREQEALKNLGTVDVTFVVGDKLSSNATRLYNTVRKKNEHTYFISNREDLIHLDLDFSGLKTAQVVSSSSTPSFVEKQIIAYLESI
ncbi:MAG TPA: 4-hydroxy-3-methylbut-2-enyl diphosphate reductase [Spirochaetales bacterium]|nr:4-hydroxy-3-methylbut-2-enyl diphosphate reductase [Spirochaetales bacterium]